MGKQDSYVAGTRRMQTIEEDGSGRRRVVGDTGDEPLLARRFVGKKLKIPRPSGSLRSSVEDDFERARTGGTGGAPVGKLAFGQASKDPLKQGYREHLKKKMRASGGPMTDADIQQEEQSRTIFSGDPDDDLGTVNAPKKLLKKTMRAEEETPQEYQTGSVLGRMRAGDYTGAVADAARSVGSAVGANSFRKDTHLGYKGSTQEQEDTRKRKKQGASMRHGFGILKGLAMGGK